jgi:hypothetical protein
MSKERELLKKLLDTITLMDDWQGLDPLTCDIEELLSEPEQEPVAWMWEQLEFDSYLEEYGEDFVLMLNEDKPNSSEEGIENIRPLYTAPPKREPLSEGVIWDNLPETPLACSGFIRGVKFAEKLHGITGGEK